MSLRVVLLTRSGRPSGAQMAWRLFENGFAPTAVIVEKRRRMVGRKKRSLLSLFISWGFLYTFKKILETIEVKTHYILRRILKNKFKYPGYLSIEELALDYPFDLYEVNDHNSLDTIRLIEHLNPDVGILMNTRRVIKQALAMPRYGFLNLHLSALPKYGGLESIFWALYHGEREIGATVHFVSEKIDEGDIVLQKKIPVGKLDDEDNLYAKALWLGTSMMVKALKQLEAGTIDRRPQNREEASYFSWPTREERALLSRRRKIEGHKSRGALHLITRMTRGGAQENTLATVRGLREKGYEVTLLTGPAWGKEGEILSQAIEEKIDLVILPELIREISLWRDFVVWIRLLSLFVRNRYAIIHTHTSKAGFLGRFAAWFWKIPVVIHTPHGHVFHSYFPKWKERFFVSLEQILACRTDRLLALTETCRKEHLALRIGRQSQWAVIPSGVDERAFLNLEETRKKNIRESFGIPSEAKIVGFVGRLAAIKGPRYFIEALPEIKRELTDTHFIFVGDGEERPLLEERVRDLGLSSSVTFPGHCDNPAEVISIMDVLVVPSLNEGMGRVIVEGGFLAKAVVAAKVGGIPDLIRDGETGILVGPRDSAAIAQAVVRVLKDPELLRRMGEKLREKALADFTEKQMIEKIDKLYREVLKEKGISPGSFLREVDCERHSEAGETTLSGHCAPS